MSKMTREEVDRINASRPSLDDVTPEPDWTIPEPVRVEIVPVVRIPYRDVVKGLFDDFGGLLDDKDHVWLKSAVDRRCTYPITMDKAARLQGKVAIKLERVLQRKTTPLPFWTEANVISATKYMTALDLDEAEKPNDEGWSGKDTKFGHWATRSFGGPHHYLAVRVATVLCGGYIHTQLRRHRS